MKTEIAALFLAALLPAGTALAQQAQDAEASSQRASAAYKAAEYPALYGMSGFSGQLIALHLKLYKGYVNNTNVLSDKLAAMLAEGGERTPEYAELKRRFGWEFDGMRLHELYFGNLGGTGVPKTDGRLYKDILGAFGSFENWKKDFTAAGLMRGAGWVVLYRDGASGRLFNVWVNEHDGGHLAGCRPLLVMDVFEHAYLNDYQLERGRYIEAFLNAADWETSEKRLAE